jgi:hypothetical protein
MSPGLTAKNRMLDMRIKMYLMLSIYALMYTVDKDSLFLEFSALATAFLYTFAEERKKDYS